MWMFIVAIVAIICTTSLIKTWINRNQNGGFDEESFNRFARSFIQHKKDMEQRVQNLEARIADEDTIKENFQDIEVPENESTLTNDLQHKNKVQS